MPEMARRFSALAHIALQGRFGADRGKPGVVLSLRHPMSIVMAIASNGHAEELAAALAGLPGATVQWAGADQYYVTAESRGEGDLYRELSHRLGGIAALSDQSHGRVIISISGSKVSHVLSKGTPVDLHKIEFPIGRSAVTQMAHVGVHLTRVGEDEFDLSVFRGFAESFWEWLTTQSEEYGYQVI